MPHSSLQVAAPVYHLASVQYLHLSIHPNSSENKGPFTVAFRLTGWALLSLVAVIVPEWSRCPDPLRSGALFLLVLYGALIAVPTCQDGWVMVFA